MNSIWRGRNAGYRLPWPPVQTDTDKVQASFEMAGDSDILRIKHIEQILQLVDSATGLDVPYCARIDTKLKRVKNMPKKSAVAKLSTYIELTLAKVQLFAMYDALVTRKIVLHTDAIVE
ncbi:hypothetical protein LTR56_019230 [Elasticomyces elasticus]|nr:hypothetical protein LTR56_019230 [Elasticomyces elasticus]KAK3633238.1 hypothetical protein LTR22_020238 [Elasticomyces elasticus]KAK4910602.1 hypothetical protein LTR49_020734 [Elasticomyces elasticus]KAK5751013.1 hypothetical protein LTS12_018914 [Elasticomyces elasticus]